MYKDSSKTVSGSESKTTNNRMELKAVIESLKSLKNKNIPIKIYVDSEYVYK
jgi:ribonuclease HI